MRTYVTHKLLGLIFVLFLVSCAGGNGVSPPAFAPQPPSGGQFTVDGFPGTFTEFPTPSGIVPIDATMGPDGQPWFANFASIDASPVAGGELLANGTFRLVTLPEISEPNGLTDQLRSGSGAIASVGGDIWTTATQPSQEDEALLIRTTAGTASVSADLGTCCGSPVNKMIAGPDGNIWIAACFESCPEFSGFIAVFTTSGLTRPGVRLGVPSQSITYSPNSLAAGPDGNIYVTATFTGVPGASAPDSSVFKISTAGKILAQFPLTTGSSPVGIVSGPDKNLWIAESGTGKIARMTTSGSVTEFTLTPPGASPKMITVGTDGALWFTDSGANALGRITTSGQMSEFTIPTPNSHPFGIASPTQCAAHAIIWFTEEAGKIGKFEF